MAMALAIAAARPAYADTLVAIAGPAHGRMAERTKQIADGAREAISKINAAGGVLGDPLVLIAVDDGCSRDNAESAARDLANRHVALVLGHPCEIAAGAAAAVYGKTSTLFIATASYHPALTTTRAGPTIFRLSGRNDTQGRTIGEILAREFAGKKLALIQDRTQYARTLFDQTVQTLKSKGVAEPITARIIAGDKDYKATVAKTKDADVIFFAGFPIEAGFVHAALVAAGSKARFIGSDSLATDEFATTFGADAKGVQILASEATSEDAVGAQPTSANSDAQSAIDIFVAAVKQAGSIDGIKVAAAIAAQTFMTSIGPVKFDASGDSGRAAFERIEWDGQRWVRAIGPQ